MENEKNNNFLTRIFGPNNPYVLLGMLAVVILIILAGSLNSEAFAVMTGNVKDVIVDGLGWWLTICITVFMIFTIGIAFTKYGNIKLGKDDDKPEYSFFAWFSMLFSCGLGIALYFWGVGEPITHFVNPPYLAEGGTIEAASLALQISNVHYGITMWATFGLVGLVLAYFAFRKDKPLTVATGLYGLIGDRAYGKIGSVINFLTLFATIGGVATSVGMGVMQLRYGASWISGIEITDFMVAIIFIVLLVLYTYTAASGVSKGIKNLSTFNMYMAFGLLGFIFITGPTIFNLKLIVQSTGEMIKNLPQIVSFNDPANVTGGWTGSWSVFYWCWHMSWAPFVGGFVAGISKGRTIREFIIGVLGAPILFTIVWFGIFGGTALNAQLAGVDIWGSMAIDVSAGIFTMFETLPFSRLLGIVMFINLLTFLATSANSAAYFSAVVASEGDVNPKTNMIILWALAIGFVGLILMFTGGLQALQSGAVASGSIFSGILILMIISMMKSLKEEKL